VTGAEGITRNFAMNFTGTDDEIIMTEDTITIGSGNPVSMSFWTQNNDPTAVKGLISLGDDTNEDMIAVVTIGSEWCTHNYVSSDCAGTTDSDWHHIVLVWESNVGLLYVDGIITVNDTLTVAIVDTPLVIGGRYRIGGTLFDLEYDGLIDEVLIYNKSLSQTEISTIYEDSKRHKAPAVDTDNIVFQTDMNSLGDSSGNGYHGISNDGEYVTTGKIGGAYYFDGTSSILTFPTITGVKSFSQWFQTHTTLVAEGGFNILGTPNSGTNFLLGHFTGAINDEAYSIQMSVGYYVWYWANFSISQFTADTWYHTTVVWNESADNYYLYINGENGGLAHKYAAEPTEQDTWDAFSLGKSSAGTEYESLQDEFMIWNKSLTASEVSAIYNSGTGERYATDNSINWIVPTIDATWNSQNTSFVVSANERVNLTNWLTNSNNSENITVTAGKWMSFDFNLTGTAILSPFIVNFGMLSGYEAPPTLPPVITLNSPANDTNQHTTSITFNYTYTDPEADAGTVKLYIDGVLNETNSSVADNTEIVFTKTFSYTNHSWYVIANDGTQNTTSETRIFNITNVLPSVTLQTPSNNTASKNTSYTFTYNVSDADSDTMTTYLYVDGVLNITNSSVSTGSTVTNTVSGFSLGNHSWYVDVNDGIGSNVSSDTWYFNVTSTIATLAYCGGVNTNYTFDWSMSNFTWDNGLYQYGATVTNVSACLYNLSNSGTATGDFTIKVNASSASHNFKCVGNSTITVNTSAQTLWSSVGVGSYRETNCTMDYLNATADWFFEVTIDAS